MDNYRNVFISHFGDHDEHLQDLKSKLLEKGYCLRNSSIDSTKPNEANSEEYIKSLLRDGISWAGTFICLIGPETESREWVNWEIEQAYKMEKKIIGVYLEGCEEGVPMPENLELYRDQLVCWDMDKIIDAIESERIVSEKPDGTMQPPSWGGNKQEC